MTPRQRFAKTMAFGRPDRVPYFEEGLRGDVLEQWHKQGLPAGADLAEMFHFDQREQISLAMGFRPPPKRWPSSRRGLAALRRRLDSDDPARLPRDWSQRVKAWARRDGLLELPIHSGLFLTLGVEDWLRLEEVLLLLAERPEQAAEMMAIYGDFAARMARRVLEEVEVDFASFSEPIAGNCGPLISPETYARVVLASYQPILEVLRRHGVQTIVYVTYANPRPLLAGVLEAGFNCLWAVEAQREAMDYRELRRCFGRRLRLIGGIDLDVLLGSRADVEDEILSKVPPLLADGGYIPLADGRVRENVPLANYLHYRRLLEDLTAQSQRGRAQPSRT